GLAAIFRLNRRVDDAEAVHPKLIAVNERLSRDYFRDSAHRFELASLHNTLSLWYRDIGRPDRAMASFQRSLAVYEPLVRDYPGERRYAVESEGVHCNLGHFYSDLGKDREALEHYAHAEARLKAILGRDRKQALAREYLVNTLRGRLDLF